MDCSEAGWLMIAAIHGEVDEASTQRLQAHASECEACGRRLALERAFESKLRSLPVRKAPAQLREQLSRSLGRPSRWVIPLRRIGRAALWPAAGALAAALVLFFGAPGSAPEPNRESFGTIVCVGCQLRPETIPLHAKGRGLDHLNGFQDDSGQLWHLLDTVEVHAMLVDDALLRRRVRLRGTFFPPSRSVAIDSIEPLQTKDLDRAENLGRLLALHARHCARPDRKPSDQPPQSTTPMFAYLAPELSGVNRLLLHAR